MTTERPAGPLRGAAEYALEAHAIDHAELDAYRQKDSLETGECRACQRLRAALPGPDGLDDCAYQCPFTEEAHPTMADHLFVAALPATPDAEPNG